MNRNYIVLTVLMLLLGTGLLFLPEKEEYNQIDPKDLMRDIVQSSRYITTDQVAQRIIEQDPTLMLIDVRPSDEFERFSLPRAVNIPMDTAATENFGAYLGIAGMNYVFYSNDDILADQVWVITRRLGFKYIYVMQGGLNQWINTIIQPKPPSESDPSEAWELYTIRKGASLYFTGADDEVNDKNVKSPVIVTRKKKTTATSGGC